MGFMDSLAETMGITEKAVLEVADFSGKQPKYNDAVRPSAGKFNGAGVGDFHPDIVKKAMEGVSAVTGQDNNGFADFGKIHRYRYEVLFNPEQLHITGYGGEEMPIQDYSPAHPERGGNQEGVNQEPKKRKPPKRSSRMAAPNTRIDFSVKLVIDRTDNSEAFFEEKLTLSQTSIAKNAAKGIKKAVNKKKDKKNTVQADVEALSALARDKSKRLARFIWGDMIYEGMINSINAEYVMFNIDGEPCRATVTLNMVLFDNDELPSSKSLWQNRYVECFNPNAKRNKGLAVHL